MNTTTLGNAIHVRVDFGDGCTSLTIHIRIGNDVAAKSSHCSEPTVADTLSPEAEGITTSGTQQTPKEPEPREQSHRHHSRNRVDSGTACLRQSTSYRPTHRVGGRTVLSRRVSRYRETVPGRGQLRDPPHVTK